MVKFEEVPEQIRARLRVDNTSGCWFWQGAKSRGYGFVTPVGGGRSVPGHRYLYRLLIEDLPSEIHLDHLCHEPETCEGGPTCLHRACFNVNHLMTTNLVANVLRGSGITARNARKTHCKHGHPFNGDNLVISKEGFRRCRECIRRWSREFAKGKLAETCRNGHPWKPETTTYKSSGYRLCLLCGPQGKTICKRGHSLTDAENVVIGWKGERICRECRNLRARTYRLAKKAHGR